MGVVPGGQVLILGTAVVFWQLPLISVVCGGHTSTLGTVLV